MTSNSVVAFLGNVLSLSVFSLPGWSLSPAFAEEFLPVVHRQWIKFYCSALTAAYHFVWPILFAALCCVLVWVWGMWCVCFVGLGFFFFFLAN